MGVVTGAVVVGVGEADVVALPLQAETRIVNKTRMAARKIEYLFIIPPEKL